MQTAQAKPDTVTADAGKDADNIPQGKLDNAEIARLVALTREAQYRQSDDVPVKPVESFRPRSLVEIAMDAQRRLEKAQAKAQAEAEDKKQQSSEATSQSGSVDGAGASRDLSDDKQESGGQAGGDDASSDPLAVAPDNELATKTDNAEKEEEEVLSDEEIAAAERTAELRAQFDKGLAQGREAGREEAHKEGYEKGFEAGRNAGQAEATAQLEASIQAFERAVVSATDPEALDVSAISAHIRDAVLSLASERAGQVIDQLPEPFAERIEGIIATIKNNAGSPVLSLNPDDMVSLKAIIETREKLRQYRVDADTRLARGDVRISLDGIGVEDRLDDRVMRVSAQPASQKLAEADEQIADADGNVEPADKQKPDDVQAETASDAGSDDS